VGRAFVLLFVLAGCDVPVARVVDASPFDAQACVEQALRRGAAPPPEVARFEAACRQGNSASCSILAVMIEQGDAARAVELYEAACRERNLHACANLAGMYQRTGWHAERAEPLLAHACKHGLASACRSLGELREAVDPGKSWQLYRTACDWHDARACLHLAAIHEKGADTARARELYKEACIHGELVGCSELDRIGTR
jgi:TPR repeat protein